MRVCVIGAGPGGIVTAKVLLENGFDVTVLDKYRQVGGVWSAGGCYDGLANQAARRLFEFADLPNRLHFADAVDTQRYLEHYAETFGVLARVRPGTEVVSVRPVEGPGRPGAAGWSVDSRPAGDETAKVRREEFDHVVVASGAHHHPRLPELPGRTAFHGTVLHSNEVRAGTFTGRRVVVVGGGKSALDLVTRAAREATSATLVQRRVNWMIPERLLLGSVGYKWILFTRFGEALLPRYHDPGCVRPIDRLDERVKRALWWLITRDLLFSTGLHRLPKHLRPDRALPFHLAHAGVMPRGYVRAVRRGLIAAEVSAVEAYTDQGLRLATGEEVAADVIVFATGHRKVFPFLDPSVRVHDSAGRLRLYRASCPPAPTGWDSSVSGRSSTTSWAWNSPRTGSPATSGRRCARPRANGRCGTPSTPAWPGRNRCCRAPAATTSAPTTSTARMNSCTTWGCRPAAPETCWRNTSFPAESPTGTGAWPNRARRNDPAPAGEPLVGTDPPSVVS